MSATGGERKKARKRAKRSADKMAHSSANVLVFERRVLIGVTAFTLIGCIIWLVAISTDYWYVITADPAARHTNRTDANFERSHAGLWRMCRTSRKNTTDDSTTLETICNYHQLFPSREEVGKNPAMDHTLLGCPPSLSSPTDLQACLDYTRTETAFSIITLMLMVMGHAFSFYTFREPGYMFKRLAGGVHFLTAATILVVVEVLINSVQYASEKLPARHPRGATWHYGFSFILAWMSFVSFVTAGFAFLACSRKRRGDKTGAELHSMSDEPNILSRS